METEKKFIETPAGEKISAVIHKPEIFAIGTVLLQHGLYSNKEGSWEERADYLADKGFKAVRFDRRGYGESDRDFHEFNLSTGIEDSISVMDHLEEENYFILGSSFGGLIGIYAAVEDNRVKALSLRSPVTYTRSVFKDMRKKVKKEGKIEIEEMPGEHMDRTFFDDLDSYKIEEAAKELDIPTMIFHGTEDEVVPIEDSREFYQMLDVEKEFEKKEGETHVFSDEGNEFVLKKTVEWFSIAMIEIPDEEEEDSAMDAFDTASSLKDQ